MLTIANSSDSKLLSLYFFRLREPPYWMSHPVMVDTKCREGSMSSRVFICEQSTRIICTRHTPNLKAFNIHRIWFSYGYLPILFYYKLNIHKIWFKLWPTHHKANHPDMTYIVLKGDIKTRINKSTIYRRLL